MPFISSVRGSFGPQSRLKKNYNSAMLSQITGGTITTVGGYRIHAFTSTGASTFNVGLTGIALDVEILMVGGGAGYYAGGGGGGEVLSISRPISSGSYSLNVGAGGTGSSSTYSTAMNGQNTTGFGETAKPGGGARSSDDRDVPISGTGVYSTVGNGGGGSSRSGGYFGSLGTSVGPGVTRYGGNRGGNDNNTNESPNQSPNYTGGGGAGAGGSVTGNSGGVTPTNGGPGVANSILGTTYYWGGGGGGGVYYNAPAVTAGSGGIGGGGGAGNVSPGSGGAGYNNGQSGSSSSPYNGGSGGANTGGGAGPGRGETTGTGGNGGSGIIVVRYQV